jgi:hypothetical protein
LERAGGGGTCTKNVAGNRRTTQSYTSIPFIQNASSRASECVAQHILQVFGDCKQRRFFLPRNQLQITDLDVELVLAA